jgi:hypothetical protein
MSGLLISQGAEFEVLVVETIAKIGPKAPMISGKKATEVPVPMNTRLISFSGNLKPGIMS